MNKNTIIKKYKSIIIGLVIGLIAVTTNSGLLTHKVLKYAEKKTFNKYEVYEVGDDIVKEESFDEIITDVFDRCIPSKITKAFLDDRIKIVIADEETCEEKLRLNIDFGGIIEEALTNKPKIVIIKTASWYSWIIDRPIDEKNKQVLCHEIGHYVDYKMGTPSSTNEWKKIRDEEFYESPIYDEHKDYEEDIEYYHIEREYFAEAFNYMTFAKEFDVEQYELLKTNCPKTFEYMQNIIDNFEE